MVKRFYFTVTDERPQEYDFKAPECLLVDDTWSLNCADDFSGVVQPADKARFALSLSNILNHFKSKLMHRKKAASLVVYSLLPTSFGF